MEPQNKAINMDVTKDPVEAPAAPEADLPANPVEPAADPDAGQDDEDTDAQE